jgi:hypothetical protein
VNAGDPAPDLSKVKPVLDEDFGGPLGDHFGRPGPKEDFRLENGLFVIQAVALPNGLRQVASAESRWQTAKGDFACQVVARVRTGGDHGWALGLYSQSGGPDRAVRLRRDGQVEVGNFGWGGPGGKVITLVGPIKPPADKSGADFNKLLVVCRDSTWCCGCAAP